ncbi:MAG TPA: hypothetical protein VMG59_03500 [Phycisphaerae bacterium]|nr:hypothetical protein [Phycisphaerae bacterium]
MDSKSSDFPASAPGVPALLTELLNCVRGDINSIFSSDADAWGGFAPGRIDVMGGIADYTGSLVCQLPLDVGIAALVQKRRDRRLRITSYNPPAGASGSPGVPQTVELNLDEFYGSGSMFPEQTIRGFFSTENHWAAYIAGAYWVLGKNRHLTSRAPGANIACFGDLPMNVGLGSSAALEIAVLSAMSGAYRLSMDTLDAAILGQKIENHIVGAPSGIMDQVVSTMGRANQLLLLRCQPHDIVGYLEVPSGISILGLTSNVRHDITGQAYGDARAAAFMAQKILSTTAEKLGRRKDPTQGYLARINSNDYRIYLRQMLPESISGAQFISLYGHTEDRATTIDPKKKYRVRAAADHHILDNARVEEFVNCLRTAFTGTRNHVSLIRAGRLMFASHASYSYCAGLGTPQTDWIVQNISKLGPKNGFYGARITGGGQGGTVAVLSDKSPRNLEMLNDLAIQYTAKFGLTLGVLIESGSGAVAVGIHQFKPEHLGVNSKQ